MRIAVRKPNVENLTSDGIPQDFAEVMQYFNEGLEQKKYSYLPRTNPITVGEIKNLWMPSLERNIVLVAESEGKVVGQTAVLYDPNSSAYEYANKRPIGEATLTTDWKQEYEPICTALLQGLAKKLIETEKQATLIAGIESPATKVLQKLGYIGEEKILDRHTTHDMSGKVIEYKFP